MGAEKGTIRIGATGIGKRRKNGGEAGFGPAVLFRRRGPEFGPDVLHGVPLHGL
jgi:hypothetical protein